MSDLDPRRVRADRILDTAQDLLLRWGYPRVTISELTRRAGIGKGTVYLHWNSRDEIFSAIAAREAAAIYDAVAAAVLAEPGEVVLHRYVRRIFVEAMQRPVLRAIFTRDSETLGSLLASPGRRLTESVQLLASREYVGVLAAAGLLREGLRPEDLDYPLPVIVFGFFGAEPFLPPELVLGLDEKADHLAETVRRTFEPPAPPRRDQLTRAATASTVIFEQLARDYRVIVYGKDGHE